MITVEFNLNKATRVILAIVAILIPLNLTIGLLKFMDHESAVSSTLGFFDLNTELGFSAWIGSLLLAAAAVAASMAAMSADAPILRRGYWVLTAGMAYLSLDEATGLHERTTEPVGEVIGAGGLFTFTWVVPATIAILVVGAGFIPFLRALPATIRRAHLIAGVLFVGSAVGLEMLAGAMFDRYGAGPLTELPAIVEETGEMLASTLFARTAFLVARDGVANVPMDRILMRHRSRSSNDPAPDSEGFGRSVPPTTK